ncbi:MAG: acyl-CoA dehydrogenase family protein [Thermoplasmata archaeon]
MPPAPLSSADAWRAKARAFVEAEIDPRAADIASTWEIPTEIPRELARLGFMGLGLPVEWDGQGGGTREVAAVLDELARANASIATLLAVHLSVCAQPIAEWGTIAQKEAFLRPLCRGEALGAFGLTEPGVGSDAAHLTCRYARDDHGFVLDGSKMFITNGGRADTLVVFATRDPELGHRGISAFLVSKGTPGFSHAQKLDKLGLRESETMELVFHDVHLPADHLLGEEGKGLQVALSALAGGRVGIAACALGVARGALDEMRRLARSRPTDGRRIAVARAFTEVAAAGALVERAATRRDAGLPFAEEASAAKLAASQAAVRVAGACVDVAGEAGCLETSVAGRRWRDARVFPIVEGTTEIQEFLLGRTLVGG